MRKFSRCILILLMVSILTGVGGYFYEKNNISPVYSSTAQLYVVPGEENEASVRASNGGLNNDFMIIFTSNVVISDAQKTLGTTEDISKYLTVSSPANSNIVELKCINADQETAKSYVDAIAKTAIKTTSIIPVKSIQILSEGTATNEAVRPDLYKKTGYITGVAAVICIILEIITVLIINAFKKPEDNSDDEWEYERYYGKYAKANNDTLLLTGDNVNLSKKEQKKIRNEKKKTDKFLDGFDPEKSDFFSDYAAANNDKELKDVYKDTAAGNEPVQEEENDKSESAEENKSVMNQHTRIIDTETIKNILSDNSETGNAKVKEDKKEDAKPETTVENTKEEEKQSEHEQVKVEHPDDMTADIEGSEQVNTDGAAAKDDEQPKTCKESKEVEQQESDTIAKEFVQSETVEEAAEAEQSETDKAVSEKVDQSEDYEISAKELKYIEACEQAEEAPEKPEADTVTEENAEQQETDAVTEENSRQSEAGNDKAEQNTPEDSGDIEEDDILADIDDDILEEDDDILADIDDDILEENDEENDEEDAPIVVLGRIRK
jgi:capsular polysaccharide biosynthesis protein